MRDAIVNEIVSLLINLSNEEKRKAGDRIVRCLGGDPSVQVTNLPKRIGPQDGGIDGRVPVKRNVINSKAIDPPHGREREIEREEDEETREAGISVKIEKESFGRSKFNTFVQDLKRESIMDGVIISAKGLSPDAKAQKENLYEEGFNFITPTLHDFISKNIEEGPIKFVKDPNDAIKEAIEIAYSSE